MEVIVDRIEGEYAVVEIDIFNITKIPMVLIPNAKEGDTIYIEVLHNDEDRKETIQNLMNSAFED